jgi:glycosyltransferase involved in cell wall biosynthesis
MSCSVIITAYKTAPYIEECLDSVFSQLYTNNFEVILGIDGCLETLDKIKEIKHKYNGLRVLFFEANMGTYVTSNTLIKEAKHENIVRFDSDDIMLPFMLSFANLHLRNYDIVRFGFDNFTKKGRYKHKGCAHGCIAYRKQVWEDLGGYKDWKCSADTDFLHRLKPEHRVKLLPETYFLRRKHSDSLTMNPETSMMSKLRKAYVMSTEHEKITPIFNTFTEI